MTWLADAHGALIEPLPTCAGFTVRHWPPNARGPGTPLRDETGSAALVVPTFVTPEQFRAWVGNRPGRYVLTQVGAHRKPLRAPAAVIVLDAGVELDAAIGTTALASILAAIAAAEQHTATAIAAAEQRTATAIAQLANQFAAHRAWIDQQLVELRGALQDIDARSLAVLLGHTTRSTATPHPRRAASPRPSSTSATPASRTTPPSAAPGSSTLTMEALLHATDDARDAHLATLTSIIEALPPLPRAVFGAILRHSDDARLTPLLALAAIPRADAIAVLTSEPSLIEPSLRTLAAHLEIPIEHIRAAWIEPDEQALPPAIRAVLTQPTATCD